MAVTASLRGNAARGFKNFKTSVSLVPVASSLASRRYHCGVDTEDNRHRLFHVHATAHRRARDALVAARLASPQPRTLSSYLSPPAVDRAVRSPARDVGRDVGPRPTARATRSFVSTSTSARLLSSTRPLVSSLARVTDRVSRGVAPEGSTARDRRLIHPIDSTGDAREERPRPIHETTAGRTKNTRIPPIDPNARSPRPHRSTRRVHHSFMHSRALDRDDVTRLKNVPRRRETLDGAELRARDAGRGATRGRRRLGGDHDAGRGGVRRHHHYDARGFARGCDVSRPRARARSRLGRSMDGRRARTLRRVDARVCLYREVSTRRSRLVGTGGWGGQRRHES